MNITKEQVRDYLIELARHQYQPVLYSELAARFGGHIQGGGDVGWWSGLLDEISVGEAAAGRPLLSVLVIGKAKNRPSGGFYKMARAVGLYAGRSAADERDFYLAELARVRGFWGEEERGRGGEEERGRRGEGEHEGAALVAAQDGGGPYLGGQDVDGHHVAAQDGGGRGEGAPTRGARTVREVGEGYFVEGEKKEVMGYRYERDPQARAACIAHYGVVCQVCGFDFEETYGELGRGYIQVHHKRPLAEQDGAYVVDPVEDLVPLCANCHVMVHRMGLLSVEELRKIMKDEV